MKHKHSSRVQKLQKVLFVSLAVLSLQLSASFLGEGSRITGSVTATDAETVVKTRVLHVVERPTFTECERKATRVKNFERRNKLLVRCHMKGN